jgi:hypothetical protein
MNTKLISKLLTVALFPVFAMQANAAIVITEVAPWASGNAPYGADWFELTNTGASAVDITGWSMDDNSAIAGVAPLAGVTSIAAGQSVIFIEGNGSGNSAFISAWFGTTPPAGLTIGNYSGSGVGLSTSGDAVNIFNSTGVLQASVSFGASDSSSPYSSFDNAAGLNNATISQLSVAGMNGAFTAADGVEIGSPAAVPEAETYAMMLAGLGLVGFMARRRKA